MLSTEHFMHSYEPLEAFTRPSAASTLQGAAVSRCRIERYFTKDRRLICKLCLLWHRLIHLHGEYIHFWLTLQRKRKTLYCCAVHCPLHCTLPLCIRLMNNYLPRYAVAACQLPAASSQLPAANASLNPLF